MNTQSSTLKLCLPIIQNSLSSVLRIIKEAPSSYQILEIWVDYIEDFSASAIERLVTDCEDRELLFLFRRQNAEAPNLPLEKRISLIEALTTHQQNRNIAIDFDIRTQKAEIDWISEHRHANTLVLSYHNYSETPPSNELLVIASEMSAHNATIFKFSTFCQTQADALRLLELLLTLRKEEKRCTVLGMGAHGLITRVFGPLWGSEIAYAPQVMANSSAPGQLTLAELQELLAQLRIIHER